MESKKLEIKEYITSNVNVFIEPLIYNLVKARPASPVTYAINWLQNYKEENSKKEESDSEDEESAEVIAELEAKIERKKKQGKSQSRMAIS